MTTWQPPIPSGALYSPQSIALGPGLALLAWCYDNVERDGSIQISLERAAADIGKPYGTIRDWWKALRGDEGKSPFFSEITPCGRKGWKVVFRSRWLDWRIMRHNYPERRDFSDENAFSADIPAVKPENEPERGNSAEISAESTNSAEKPAVSSQLERRDLSAEHSGIKVLQDTQPPPPPTPSAPEPEQAAPGAAALAVGGGGGRWRSHPVYQLLRGAGIVAADRLMPTWKDTSPEKVETLLADLRKKLWSADGDSHLAGRIYRAMLDGPEMLLSPPARAAPVVEAYTPPPRPARTDPNAMRRALAAAAGTAHSPDALET